MRSAYFHGMINIGILVLYADHGMIVCKNRFDMDAAILRGADRGVHQVR